MMVAKILAQVSPKMKPSAVVNSTEVLADDEEDEGQKKQEQEVQEEGQTQEKKALQLAVALGIMVWAWFVKVKLMASLVSAPRVIGVSRRL